MKVIRICLSIIMLIVGAIVLTFLVVNTQGRKNFVGDFLLSSYSFMGYIVPIFFFWLFYIIHKKDSVLHSAIWPLFALVPFFFFSLSLRAFLWNQSLSIPPLWAITQLFGQNGAGIFWLVLGTSTILLLSMLYYTLNTKEMMKQNNNQDTKSVESMDAYQNYLRSNISNNRDIISPYVRYQQNPISVQSPPTIKQYNSSLSSPQSAYQPTDVSQNNISHNSIVHDVNERSSQKNSTSYEDIQSKDDAVQQDSKKDIHLKYASYPTGMETEKYEDVFPSNNDSRYILFFHKDNSVRKQLYYTEYERELLQDNNSIGAEGFTSVVSATPKKEIKTVNNVSPSEIRNSQYVNKSSTDIPKNAIHGTEFQKQQSDSISPNDMVSYTNDVSGSQNMSVVETPFEDNGNVQNEIERNMASEGVGSAVIDYQNKDEVDIFDIYNESNSIESSKNRGRDTFLQLDENDDMFTDKTEFGLSEIEDEFDDSDFEDNVFDDDFYDTVLDADDSIRKEKKLQETVLDHDDTKEYIPSDITNNTKKAIHKDLDNIVNEKLKNIQEKSMLSQDKADDSFFASQNNHTVYTNDFIEKDKEKNDIITDNFIEHVEKQKSTEMGVSKKFATILEREKNNIDLDESVGMKKKTIKSYSNQVKKRKGKYFIPISGILNPPIQVSSLDDSVLQETSRRLEITLQEFNIQAKVISICRGPVVTLFEILPASGVRVRRIVELSDNIALRLAAPSIRIVAPIPSKEAVGIEVPNKIRDIVSFSDLISQSEFHNKKYILPIALGKNILAKTIVVDLAKTPHMLIAGATGSGKSVCVNSIICSLLYNCNPESVKLILIDPKIVELSFYNDIPHLLTPVISDPVKSVKVLHWCVEEMEQRYGMLEQYNVREIESYNKKIYEQNSNTKKMSYIVIVIDEFADLMMTSGKEIETLVSRITAKSRAVGIHLVIATQRPSTDVITGLIKSNVPTRISFMVASKIDSRIILDVNGAEKLLGKGDMLYSSAQHPFPDRLQGAYLEEEEVERVVEHVKQIGGEPQYMDESIFEQDKLEGDGFGGVDDPLWDQAVEEVMQSKRASASHLQRRFKIGYNRAARLIDDMEYKGIIGPQQGGKQREVFLT